MTRRSKRELERALEELRADDVDVEEIECRELTAEEKHRLAEIYDPGDDIYNPDDEDQEEKLRELFRGMRKQ